MDYLDIIDRFRHLNILVVGDPMEDHYHFGRVDRISPEAPVPVFVEERTEIRRGGADNVKAQLEAVGVQASHSFPPKPWIEKHRYMVGIHQLFRADLEYQYEPTQVQCKLFNTQAVVISDYAKGYVTGIPNSCNCPVIVDPKGSDWLKYEGCTVICPNEKEYNQWDRRGDFPKMVVKLGERGMRVIERGKPIIEIPARARHVFDVTGAGDCVVAIIAAAIAAGAILADAAVLASIGAGYVVGEVGTAACSAAKLKELCVHP